MTVSREVWGALADGREVHRFELTSSVLRAGLLTWGATLQSLHTPDREGRLGDVVLGFDTLAPYMGAHPYLGALVGRYANRIAGSAFTLDGRLHRLPRNEGTSTLHGGPEGFHRRVWAPLTASDLPNGGRVTLGLVSPDGDMGFPGAVRVLATFIVSGNTMQLNITATTDAPTVVNLTSHSYFNLHGGPTPNIDDHMLCLAARHYLATDASAIPLPGSPVGVTGTPHDFRVRKPIGRDRPRGGYDHTWVLDTRVRGEPRKIAVLDDPCTGRRMSVRTTEPGLQFYSGNLLDGSTGKNGLPLHRRSGLCLETQHFPDSPNRPDFPSVVLRPGCAYRTTTIWSFTTSNSPYSSSRAKPLAQAPVIVTRCGPT